MLDTSGTAAMSLPEILGDSIAPFPEPARTAVRIAPLVALSREGDMRAFRDLYEQSRPGLFNVVVRLADSEDDAHEIVQRAFVKAWQSLSELRDDLAFGGWLRRIATNLLRDHWRRANRHVDLPDDADLGALADPSPDAADQILEAERLRHLEEAVGALPEMFRLPVVLHYLDERSVEEVAGILDLPRGTVLSRLSRARARLQAILLPKRDPT